MRAQITMGLILLVQVGVILYGYFHGPGIVPIVGISIGETLLKVIVAASALLLPSTLIHLHTLFCGLDSQGRLRRDTLLFRYLFDGTPLLKNDKVRICPSYWTLGVITLATVVFAICVSTLLGYAVKTVISPTFLAGVSDFVGWTLSCAWWSFKFMLPVSLYVIAVLYLMGMIDNLSRGRYREFESLVTFGVYHPLLVVLIAWPTLALFSIPGFWEGIRRSWPLVMVGTISWSVGTYVVYVLWVGVCALAVCVYNCMTRGLIAKIAFAIYDRFCIEIPVAPEENKTQNE